ncbi:MAG: LAGLIDADG family homing endonuclease [Thaumarchaeota archaeon]|nr:LAGLIDADG family homing endonuclease [Nitrososphaerota archaeon]
MEHLYHTQGASMTDIADLIGNKTSGYVSWLFGQLGIQAKPFEQARLQGIIDKVRIHERKPFDGTDEDKAYMLGLRHGDLSASTPWKGAVRISTSTTHPAMVELFESLFVSKGHVYRYPRYKKDTSTYEWNISANVDGSFIFLLESEAESWEWIGRFESTVLAYLAGLFDAEGHVGIYRNARTTALTLTFYNTNLGLLSLVHTWLTTLGYSPLKPYLDKPKGFRSPGYHIEMKKDYWRLVIATFEESQSLLTKLPLRHREKIMKKRLGLAISRGDRWTDVRDRVAEIRQAIRSERNAFVAEAETQVLRREAAREKQ